MFAICHTGYSLKAGVRSPRAWARAAAERGYSALAVADLNGLYGAVHFQREVIDVGLRPILAATLHWGLESSCVILVPTAAGYRQLCSLLSRRHLAPAFDLATLLAGAVDELLFLVRAPGLLHQFRDRVPADNLFGLPRHPLSCQQRPRLWDTLPSPAPTAFVPDAWCIDADDRTVLTHLRTLRRLSGCIDHFPEPAPGLLLPTVAAWRTLYPNTAVAERLAARCRFQFPANRTYLPVQRLPAGTNPNLHLRQLCREALPRLYSRPRLRCAAARLHTELQIISRHGFADYFLYVHEITAFARQRRISTEVRGSAASSIVSYLLGFTHCCPLEHELYFERFMNPGRRDCPDIDIDIADNRRDEVINHCYSRWGEDHVAMIATIVTYRARSAIRDAGRILRLSPARVKRLLERDDANPRKTLLLRIAAGLTGLPRHVGMHCGGLVITPMPLTDLTPLMRTNKGLVISHYEKDQAKAIGLVKMDILGNSALTVIDEARAWVRQRGNTFCEPGPGSDYKVNRLFANGDTLGVYQCESPGMRQLCQALRPTTRKDVASALSLIRPGPAAAGMKEAFIRRRRGREPVTYLHPRMASFLGSTYGVMLYQEDVMNVAVQLAGYSIGDADLLRRNMSDSGAATSLAAQRHEFVLVKAATAGLPASHAAAIWQQVSRFASYSYCKAHASVYGRLAWLTARLKAHEPQAFYAAVLNHHKSMYPKRVFVWDARRHGIPILPPDVTRSALPWTPTRAGIRAGLDVVKGMRRATCRQLLQERRRQGFRGLSDLRRRVSFRPGELECLILIGACRAWGSRPKLLALAGCSEAHTPPLPLPLRSTVPDRLLSLEQAQLLFTGIPFCRHPVPARTNGTCAAADMPQFVNREVCMLGLLDACKVTRTKETPDAGAREMSFVTLEDETGLFELVLFPDQHQAFCDLFSGLGPYRVRGVVRRQWDSFTMELRDAEAGYRST